jgi:preprotein translocase subunit YajC
MKNWTIISFFLRIWEERKRKKRFKKKIEELKKRDPFIYNH